MTGAELKQLRHDLGDAIDRRLTHADMAKLCGLASKNGGETMRKWEAGEGPSGPVASLLLLLRCASLEHPLPAGLSRAGADALFPEIRENQGEGKTDDPATIAESVFRDMILAEVRRRVST